MTRGNIDKAIFSIELFILTHFNLSFSSEMFDKIQRATLWGNSVPLLDLNWKSRQGDGSFLNIKKTSSHLLSKKEIMLRLH